MNGNESGMLCSSEITGVVYTVVLVRHRFITRDMQKEILEKNRLNGSCQFASPAMTSNTDIRNFSFAAPTPQKKHFLLDLICEQFTISI